MLKCLTGHKWMIFFDFSDDGKTKVLVRQCTNCGRVERA
jgi:hypothetical protein